MMSYRTVGGPPAPAPLQAPAPQTLRHPPKSCCRSFTGVTSHAWSHHLDAEDEGAHEDTNSEGGGCGAEADDAPVGLHVCGPASRPEKADD